MSKYVIIDSREVQVLEFGKRSGSRKYRIRDLYPRYFRMLEKVLNGDGYASRAEFSDGEVIGTWTKKGS